MTTVCPPPSSPARPLASLLNNNQFTGPILPDRWSIGPAFESLVEMQVRRGAGGGWKRRGQQATIGQACRAVSEAEPHICPHTPCAQLAGNRFSGTYPYTFALTNTSFANVLVMCAPPAAAAATAADVACAAMNQWFSALADGPCVCTPQELGGQPADGAAARVREWHDDVHLCGAAEQPVCG